jgi:hypothetical protein
LRDEREQTPWYRRAERRDLGHALETNERAATNRAGRVDELREDVERLIGAARPLPEGQPAREVLAYADWLDRGRALTRDAHDLDLGIDR